MKKSIWLMVILFVMAGGVYTYAFFSSKKITNASTVPSCCTEIATPTNQAVPVQSGCSMECPTGVTACPSAVPVYSTPSTNSNTVTKPTASTEPCDNCVCGTDEECPNEDKCDACLEEEQQRDENKNEAGSGRQNRNGQNNP